MGVLGRLNQVVKSNLNSLVDRAEDPHKLISQTIDDLQAEVKRARKELLETLGTAKRLLKKQDEHLAEAADWERKATLALREGDDGLAREALRIKLDTERRAEDVAAQARQQENLAGEMRSTLEEVERKIEDLKARKSSLAAQVRRARDEGGGAQTAIRSGAFAELDRMVGRIDQLEAEVEAADVLEEPRRAEVEARFRELERKSRSGEVEDQLAALKKKLDG